MGTTDARRAAALALLGLTPSSTRAQITHAYRQLARATHPDVSNEVDAGPRFDALTSAYRLALAGAEDAPPETPDPGSDPEPEPDHSSAAPERAGAPVDFAAGPVRVLRLYPPRRPRPWWW